MKLTTILSVASLLVVARSQDTDTTSTSTSTDDSGPTITLAPELCPTAGLDSCYIIEEILTPTVYVIITVTGSIPASLSDVETITVGDPLFTQTDNIITGTGEPQAPVTAIIEISYSESDGTTCDPATETSILTGTATPCFVLSASPGGPQPTSSKTRVFVKAVADDTQGKSTDGGDGNTPSTSASVIDLPANTSDASPAAPTETTASATTAPEDSATSQTTDTTMDTTGNKIELSTSLTTMTEVSDGTTRLVTKPIATFTKSTPTSTTSSPSAASGTNAANNNGMRAEILLGALGLAAIVGL